MNLFFFIIESGNSLPTLSRLSPISTCSVAPDIGYMYVIHKPVPFISYNEICGSTTENTLQTL